MAIPGQRPQPVPSRTTITPKVSGGASHPASSTIAKAPFIYTTVPGIGTPFFQVVGVDSQVVSFTYPSGAANTNVGLQVTAPISALPVPLSVDANENVYLMLTAEVVAAVPSGSLFYNITTQAQSRVSGSSQLTAQAPLVNSASSGPLVLPRGQSISQYSAIVNFWVLYLQTVSSKQTGWMRINAWVLDQPNPASYTGLLGT